MRIVVSSTGNSVDSEVDMRFGRCLFFLIIETENNEIKDVKAIKNQGNVEGHGAGILAGQQVANLKPDKIITGHMGPNAFRVIQETGIDIYQANGPVKDAVKLLLDGNLPRLKSFVRGHFGRGRKQGWRR